LEKKLEENDKMIFLVIFIVVKNSTKGWEYPAFLSKKGL